MKRRSRIHFEPQWKEELVCTTDQGDMTFELTMGILTAYFPTQEKWEASAPDWAKNQWNMIREELTQWCLRQNIPLVIEEGAWVVFRPKKGNE